MPIYNYISVDKAGNLIKGTLEGHSTQNIHQQLRDMKLTVIELAPVDAKKLSDQMPVILKHRRISSSLLAMFTFQLGTLLSADIPIAKALKNIANQTENPYLKQVILALNTDVIEGRSIAFGMNKFKDVFKNKGILLSCYVEKISH